MTGTVNNSGPATGSPNTDPAANAATGTQDANQQAAGTQQQAPVLDGQTGVVPQKAAEQQQQLPPVTGVWAGLTPELQQVVAKNGFGEKPVDELVKSYDELSRKLGNRVEIPTDADGIKKLFVEKLGGSNDPTAYAQNFKPPADPNDARFYSQDSATLFAAACAKTGVPAAVAKEIHDAFFTEYAKVASSQLGDMNKSIENVTDTLEKTWGGKQGTPAFDTNLAYVNTMIRNNGGAELLNELKSAGILAPNGAIQKAPRLVAAIAQMAKGLYSEDVAVTGFTGVTSNPFAQSTLSLEGQGQLVNEALRNPARAEYVRQLITAAGGKPERFGL